MQPASGLADGRRDRRGNEARRGINKEERSCRQDADWSVFAASLAVSGCEQVVTVTPGTFRLKNEGAARRRRSAFPPVLETQEEEETSDFPSAGRQAAAAAGGDV